MNKTQPEAATIAQAPQHSQTQLPPAWDWPELLAVYMLSQIVHSVGVYGLLASGVLARVYGTERVTATPLPALDATRFGLWSVVVAFPMQLALTLVLLWHTQRVTLAQLGVPGSSSIGRQLREAAVLGLLFIPLVYGIYAVSLIGNEQLGVPSSEHSFTQLARQGLSSTEAVLLALAACVVAPIWEELLFRGLIQPWVLARGGQAQLVVLALAIAVGLLHGRVPAISAAVAAALTIAWPASWRGMYGVAVLFAFVHAAAWPSPIPLLVLGLVLGWLARRGGLIGPIALHAGFNAVGCLELFVSFLPKLS
ncbi:MAG: CPBP family intramembrane glutamic endopeptidase [Gemmataceae bacterium]